MQRESERGGGRRTKPIAPEASSSNSSSSSSNSSSSSSNNSNNSSSSSNEPSDDELAFQMLELAKKCLSKKLNYTPAAAAATAATAAASTATTAAATAATPAAGTPSKDIAAIANDLAFACMRLGDLQLMNNRFDDATQDYGEAVSVRLAFGAPPSLLLAPRLSLAQATFFSGDLQKALQLFKDCESLACRIRDGLLPLPEGTSLKAVMETAEDLAIQIAEIQQQQQQQQQQQVRQQGSQCEAKSLLPRTTSSFDSPLLAPSEGVRRVAIELAAERALPELDGHTPKKRRIDLKALQQQQQQQQQKQQHQNAQAMAGSTDSTQQTKAEGQQQARTTAAPSAAAAANGVENSSSSSSSSSSKDCRTTALQGSCLPQASASTS
ncbi:hypothetical protein Efla_007715 [Eimeria flavescens]